MVVEGNIRKTKLKLQILRILRIDEYVGFYEEYGIANGLNPMYCISVLPENVKGNVSKTLGIGYEKLVDAIVIRTAESSTCYEECLENDSVCQLWALK